MRWLFGLTLLWIWVSSWGIIHAQARLTASIQIDNPRPKIGEPINGTMIIEYDEALEVLQRPPLSGEWGIFEITSVSELERTSVNGRITERQSFVLVAWQTGDHTLPLSEILYRVRGTSDLERYTLPDVFLSIPSVLDEASLSLKPDENPITMPFLPTWLIAIGISLIVIVFLGLYELLRYYARQNATHTPIIDPQILLFDALRQHQTDPQYDAMSYTLRAYLNGRYGISAHDMTDQEIITTLKADGRLASYQLATLSEILEQLSVGKFSTTQIGYSPEKVLKMIEGWAKNIHVGQPS
ncbi:MAG: hypothetical protein KJ043_09255 [Anaerolineae bacterium]|nr:hypothetical protein [Anaerolineae bacterium]